MLTIVFAAPLEPHLLPRTVKDDAVSMYRCTHKRLLFSCFEA